MFNRTPLLGLIFSLALLLGGFPLGALAAQFDAPYYDLQKKNKDKWAAEDKQIDAKLAALEKKFGKKPNIIYILADDVGWGEMGWQGGGQHRSSIKSLWRACVFGPHTLNRPAHPPELPLTPAVIRCELDYCLSSGQDRPRDFLARK